MVNGYRLLPSILPEALPPRVGTAEPEGDPVQDACRSLAMELRLIFVFLFVSLRRARRSQRGAVVLRRGPRADPAGVLHHPPFLHQGWCWWSISGRIRVGVVDAVGVFGV